MSVQTYNIYEGARLNLNAQQEDSSFYIDIFESNGTTEVDLTAGSGHTIKIYNSFDEARRYDLFSATVGAGLTLSDTNRITWAYDWANDFANVLRIGHKYPYEARWVNADGLERRLFFGALNLLNINLR